MLEASFAQRVLPSFSPYFPKVKKKSLFLEIFPTNEPKPPYPNHQGVTCSQREKQKEI